MPIQTLVSSIVTNLPAAPVTDDPGLRDELLTIYNAIQALHQEATRKSRIQCIFDEAASPGQLLSLYSVGGVLHARLANATNNTRPAAGFCGAAAVAAGKTGEVIYDAMNQYTTGLTPGTLYYLGTVNGSYSTAKPGVSGNIQQPIGYAVSTNQIYVAQNINWTQVP